MDTSPLIHEAALAQKLGVSREVLAEIRAKLDPDTDWQPLKKGAAGFTPSGLEKIAQALATPSPLPEVAPEEKTAPATAYVRRAARLNPRMIFCTREKDGGGPELAVRVRDARCFVPGHVVEIVPADAGTWRLHGPQPRGRGKLRLPRA